MVITTLNGGLGNQFYQYCAGRYLAYKLNTQLKIDIGYYLDKDNQTAIRTNQRAVQYVLGDFNIQEEFVTPEEINYVKEHGLIKSKDFWEAPDNLQGDILLPLFSVPMGSERYFINIVDILRKEFTLKKPFSPHAEAWRQKILSAECSVAMHFRHGDYAYHPNLDNDGKRPWFNPTPISYAQTCVKILKVLLKNFTLFVFSDNIAGIKESLQLDVPTEFVEGCKSATEELILMSLCQHTVTPGSSFSKSAAILNPNPNKILLHPHYTTAEEVQKYLHELDTNHLIIRAKRSQFFTSEEDCDRIVVPADFYDKSGLKIPPFFSLLLVINDTPPQLPSVADTLDSIFKQDYEYYEVIIIDNATTDGSDEICHKVIADKSNVTFKRLDSKVSNAKAWNTALDLAKGKYVSFLKNGDRLYNDFLRSTYLTIQDSYRDILHYFVLLAEYERGRVDFYGKKYTFQRDPYFKEEKNKGILVNDGQEAAKLLLNHDINSFLGTKVYNRKFLNRHNLRFNEHLDNDKSELNFQVECFSHSKEIICAQTAFYVAPKS